MHMHVYKPFCSPYIPFLSLTTSQSLLITPSSDRHPTLRVGKDDDSLGVIGCVIIHEQVFAHTHTHKYTGPAFSYHVLAATPIPSSQRQLRR